MKKVLVFPGGTEIGLEIVRGLKDDFIVYSSGDIPPNPYPSLFEDHIIIPPVNKEGWLERLNEVIEKYNIEYIFPAHDGVITECLNNKDKINAKIISHPLETWKLCHSKSDTYKLFKDLLLTPKQYKDFSEINEYPIFIKPDRGSGTLNCFKIDNKIELRVFLKRYKDLIILEYLPGKEYTIDCFSDREKGLLFAEGRERLKIRNGISTHSRIVKREEFYNFAMLISNQLEFHGAWFFQLKEDKKGLLKLLEIGPRIAGTMALNRNRGVNFPLLSIKEYERIPITIWVKNRPTEIYRILQNFYY